MHSTTKIPKALVYKVMQDFYHKRLLSTLIYPKYPVISTPIGCRATVWMAVPRKGGL